MRTISAAAFLLLASLTTATAAECLAVAQGPVRFQAARVQLAALAAGEVHIRYAGHSTFRIESPGGVTAATDYAGYAGEGGLPTVVTMNQAHSSHYTDFPDPDIKHVLRGWGEGGAPARHDVQVGDMRVRNVTTDIRDTLATRITNGNSIFVFEVADLCIGHLGHLHHELTPGHIGWIGRLDVVMVPVDGGLTMPVENMMNVLKELKVRVILPMHARFTGSLERFTEAASKHFAIERLNADDMVVSANRLPSQPTVFIMPGM